MIDDPNAPPLGVLLDDQYVSHLLFEQAEAILLLSPPEADELWPPAPEAAPEMREKLRAIIAAIDVAQAELVRAADKLTEIMNPRPNVSMKSLAEFEAARQCCLRWIEAARS